MKNRMKTVIAFALLGVLILTGSAALLLGVYSGNLILIGASVILGIGHIGIHLMHRKEIRTAEG